MLVDFSAFPQKLIDLLRLCAAEEEKSTPKYLLELVSPPRGGGGGGGSAAGRPSTSIAQLKLIETNPFKNLEHLSLKLVVGSDTDVKTHLAAKLKALSETLSSETSACAAREAELRERLRSAEHRLSDASARLEEERTQSQVWRSERSPTDLI